MTEEEKKAIDEFNKLLADFKGLSKLSLWYEIDAEEQNELYNKLYPLLNLIENQQKEIEEKTTILLAGAKKVNQLEKEIRRLEKDNDTLSKLVIVNEDKVIKELDLISKDKIREKLKEARKINWHTPKLVIEYFEELLEEN